MIAGWLAAALVAAALLATCTGGGSTAATPTTPGAQQVALLCRDLQATTDLVEPLLDRMDQGIETTARFQQEVLQVNASSRRLYREAAAFASQTGTPVFGLVSGLVADLSHIVYGELGVHSSPDDVPLGVAGKVRQDLAALRKAVADGTLPCPGGLSPATSP